MFVDDEPNVLQSIRRNLRKQFKLDTAEGGEAALQKLGEDGGFAVIVSDMRMPGMNGVELLSQAKQRWPETVRVMLTGNADMGTAVQAINEGQIFRFLSKPCSKEALLKALKAAVRQHRLVVAETQILEETLRGSIKLVTDILSLVSPMAFGRASRVCRTTGKVVERLAQQMSEASAALRFERAAQLRDAMELAERFAGRQAFQQVFAARELLLEDRSVPEVFWFANGRLASHFPGQRAADVEARARRGACREVADVAAVERRAHVVYSWMRQQAESRSVRVVGG